jgi:tetratricopeptide (TPR) repeat protein
LAETSQRAGRVERALTLFEAGEWGSLADLAVSAAFDGDDVKALAAALGGEKSAEEWQDWANAHDRAEALTAIGFLLRRMERDAEAVDVLEEAQRLGQDCSANLGELHVYLDDWASAEPWLRLALDTRAHWWERAAYRLGEHAVEVEDRYDDDVVALLEVGTVAAEESVVVLSQLYWRRGEIDRARRVLEEALPENDLVSLPLGNLLRDEFGDIEGARAAYEDGYARGDAYSAFNLALLLEADLDLPDEATDWMRTAARGGDAAARAKLTVRGEDGWAEEESESGDSPAWMHALYDDDLLPHLHGSALPDSYPTIFRINDVVPAPAPGLVARAARIGLPIVIEPHTDGFDLSALGSGIAEICDLTIADAAGIRGWGALAEARSLGELEMDGSEPSEPVDLTVLPELVAASIRGRNAYSAAANPTLRSLSLTMLDGQAVPTIGAPIEFFGVKGRAASKAIGSIVHPQYLEELVVIDAVDFDCSTLLGLPALRDVSLLSCSGVTNTWALREHPLLVELQVEDCRDVERAGAVAALVARLERKRGNGDDDGR